MWNFFKGLKDDPQGLWILIKIIIGTIVMTVIGMIFFFCQECGEKLINKVQKYEKYRYNRNKKT